MSELERQLSEKLLVWTDDLEIPEIENAHPEYVRNCSNTNIMLSHSADFYYFVPKHVRRLLSISRLTALSPIASRVDQEL